MQGAQIALLEEEGYKSFALIGGPSKSEDYKDYCVTLVRCKEERIAKELRHWGSFSDDDIELVNGLDNGEILELDYASTIIRLS